MVKKICLITGLFFIFSLFLSENVDAGAGFNRLKAAGQGVKSGDSSDEGSSKDKSDKGGSGNSSGSMDSDPAKHGDIIFLGVFETYIPSKRLNARMTVYAEPRKFLLGHRACLKTSRIRDQINHYFFENPPKIDRRGNAETEGMDTGVREAIKKALKTKLEYFTSIYVVSGRYSALSLPKDLKELQVTDCAGVIAAKKEMDKADK
ncbi:hypothetical protein GCM10011332_10920 [Terasakiella brassicae]|uniref:Uncharacterized protein n=1 Tax=Terasakiella brassicae TaxID=1634917 RepID=A0A917BVJ9_9PROT|nr:hypothetical protein [Terasakiella brassicae]GGF59122.1 hypothetical protein GCM10011332_10920 [Terasakiella brassicae]